MKTFKNLFLAAMLLLGGGLVIAQSTGSDGGNTSSQSGSLAKSNPKDCDKQCLPAPKVKEGTMSSYDTIVVDCNSSFNLDDYEAPPKGDPKTTKGTLYISCKDGSTDEQDINVIKWDWKITDRDGFDADVPGIYNIKATGTAVFDNKLANCTLTQDHTFTVVVNTLEYVSPGEITLCETLPVKVSCGAKVVSVTASPSGIVEIVDDVKVKGIAAGTATLTVETYGGETVEGYVEVKDCRVTKKPEAVETFMGFFDRECETVTNDEGEEVKVYVYYYIADFVYKNGKYIKCPEDGDGSEGSGSAEDDNEDGAGPGIDFGLDQETYTWFEPENAIKKPTAFPEIMGFYTIDNSPFTGSLSVFVGGSWEKCGESDSIGLTAIELFDNDNQPNGDMPTCEPTPFAPQNKYTGLDIHGQPQSAAKPQQEQEEDSYKSDFNVDAYHLSPSFSTADISIPLQGTDLRLELRRRNSTDVTTTESTNVDNMPHRVILGRTWRVNLAPIAYVFTSSTFPGGSAGDPEDECSQGGVANPSTDQYWVAVDDGGGEFKYSFNGDNIFLPIKKYFSDFESGLHDLSGTPGESLFFTKQNGMVFEYEPVSYTVADSEIELDFTTTTTSLTNFHRCKSITDRTGNKLNYVYATAESLFPSRIEYAQNPQIYIDFHYNADQTKLLKAVDPLGREINYDYTNGYLSKVTKPVAPVALENNPKETQDMVQEFSFTYNTRTIPAFKEVPPKTTHFMESMTDPEGNSVSMTYTTFTQTNERKHVVLRTLTTPDGTFTATVNKISDTFRNVKIVDTKGNGWLYKFLGSTRRAVYSSGSLGGSPFASQQCELMLDTFYRTQFATPEFTRTMQAHFITDFTSSINMDFVIDYHGIKTEYVYGKHPVTYFRNGVEVTEEYDFGAHNQPYQEILDPGGLNIVKEFGYEENTNQMVRIVDGNGNVTTYDVDDQGNRLREIAPLGKITTFTYDLGFQTSATDADGRTTLSSRVYDATGWTDTSTVTGYNNELSITTVKKCDLVGNVIQTIDGNGNVTDNEYDDTNSLISTQLPAVDDFDTPGEDSTRPTITFHRNKNRQVVAKQDARGNWTFTEYDGMLRPKKTTVEFISDPTKNIVTETQYDATGNKSVVIDPRGVRYEFKYDSFNNLIKEIKDVGGENLVATYEYGEGSGNDVFGDTGFVPTKKVDARGISTILEYDNAYRLIRTSRGFEDRESLLSEITYDNAGNVVRTVTFNNQVTNIEGEYINDSEGITKGNQVTVTEYDALNRPVATAVDLDGDGASTEDPDDIVTFTFYDITGNVVVTVDPEGHASQTEYDGAGRVVKQVVNLDDDPQFIEAGGNFYTISAQADDIVTEKTYDNNNNVLTETIINDTPIEVDGQVTSLGEQTVTKTYDALNRVKTVTDPEGNTTETKYDLNNNVRYVKNARGFETETEFDEVNRSFKQILPTVFDQEANSGNGDNVKPEVLTFYDTNNNVIKTIDARGLVTENLYDNLNRLEKTTQIVDANDATKNIVTENAYDGNNNLIESKFFRDDQTLITTTIYDALDRPLITEDPEGYQAVVFCDLVGNKVKLFDKRANANADETPNEEPQLRYFTEVTFDLANRMVRNTLPEIDYFERTPAGLSNVITDRPYSEVVYQKNSWVDSTIDLNGNETSTTYDNAGRKLSVTNAIGQTITYTYDKSSNVLTQSVENDALSGGDQVTTYQYDKRNLLLSETLNKDHATLSRTYRYEYDENGNKDFREFPNGDTTTYNYDALDRLQKETYANAGDESREYFYNNNGAVIKCIDITGTVNYQYDILGRQVLETKLNSNGTAVSEVESVYDKANNRIRCFFPGDKKTLVSLYDKRNLLVTMKGFHGKVLPDDEAGLTPETTTYTYTANGVQKSIALPNGQVTEKEFDDADRIISSTTSTGVINSYTAEYSRDAVGNQLKAVETRTITNGTGTRERTLEFTYDRSYRLTGESDQFDDGDVTINTYIYDLQGNRLSRIQKIQGANDQDSWIYTNDILNRTTAVQIDLVGPNNNSSYVYNYDENGNRKLRTFVDENNGTSVHTYHYDQENRLVKVVDDGVDIFEASYDYRTRRTAKTEVNAQDLFETTSYIYDAGTSCQEIKVTTPGEEYDGTNGTLDKQYIRGNGMGGGIGSVCYMERVADFNETSTDVQGFYEDLGYGINGSDDSLVAEYYAYNAVGSVVANTDQQGFVIHENDFDAYGRIIREEDHTSNNFPIEFGGSSNDLLFSTKERDYSTGLDNFGFRYYDSILGKFITRDPSGYPDGPNNYLYVNNNPINSIDPLGLDDKTEEEVRRRQQEIAERRAAHEKGVAQVEAEKNKANAGTSKASQVNQERIENKAHPSEKTVNGNKTSNYYVQDGELKGKPNPPAESMQKTGTGNKNGNPNPDSTIKKATEGINKADDIRAQRVAKADILTSLVSMLIGFYNLAKADNDSDQIQAASDAMKGTGYLATGLAAMNGSKLAQGANPWLMAAEALRPSSLSPSQIMTDIANGDNSGGSIQNIITVGYMTGSVIYHKNDARKEENKAIKSDMNLKKTLEQKKTLPSVLKRINNDIKERQKEKQKHSIDYSKYKHFL